MEGVMQVWLAAEVQLLSVSGFPSDIPIAANPLHRRGIEATTGSRPKHLPAANPSPMQARYVSHSAVSTGCSGTRQRLPVFFSNRGTGRLILVAGIPKGRCARRFVHGSRWLVALPPIPHVQRCEYGAEDQDFGAG